MTPDYCLLTEKRTQDALKAFSDDDWQDIIAFATADQHDHYPVAAWREAGRHELIAAAERFSRAQPSHVLASCARDAPQRMARLFCALPTTSGAHFLTEILERLDATRISAELREQVLAHAWRIRRKPLMAGCLHVLQAAPLGDWTSANVEHFTWYLTKARLTPGYVHKLRGITDDEYRQPARPDGLKFNGDPYLNGQAIPRGRAVGWLSAQLANAPDEFPRFRRLLGQLTRHNSVAVRACLVQLCHEHLERWPDEAVDWSLAAFRDTPDLFHASCVDSFFQSAVRFHYPRLAELLAQGLTERENLAALESSGRALARAALHWPEAELLADQALDSYIQVRNAMIRLLAEHWSEGSTSYARTRLEQAFYDGAPQTYRFAKRAFETGQWDWLGDDYPLLESLLESPANATAGVRPVLAPAAIAAHPERALELAATLIERRQFRFADVTLQTLHASPSATERAQQLLAAMPAQPFPEDPVHAPRPARVATLRRVPAPDWHRRRQLL